MAFFKKSRNANYDFLSGYAWHVPGVGGMFAMLGWLLVGGIIGNVISMIVLALLPGVEDAQTYAMLVSYPVMFIPPMIAAKHISNRNMAFEKGYYPDNNNFAPKSGWVLALLCTVATLCCAFVMDGVNTLLPDIPDFLRNVFEQMTGGKLWVNLLAVSIFAPIFEEWLCRGTILRGLLNYDHVGKDGKPAQGMNPYWAIVVSALFFAFIHLNPWQALPAFVLGCLFGYVYYRTGSLKLTMLMHCANNTLALVLGQSGKLEDVDSFKDILAPGLYWPMVVACILLVALFVLYLRKVDLLRPQGNCTEVDISNPAPQS